MFRPFSAGWFLTPSGVSPCGTCQTISPFDRLIALMVEYGGLRSGNPWTVVPPRTGVAVGAGAAAVAGAAAGAAPRPARPRPAGPAAAAPSAPRPGRGKSAALPNPGPSEMRNGCPAWPRTYLMSEKPAGGSIRPMVVRHELHA